MTNNTLKNDVVHSRLAFTLAEVMITLAIIGVLAAMTVPALVQYTNNQEYFTKFKKIYSELSAAAQSIKHDNGGTFQYIAQGQGIDPRCSSKGVTDDACYVELFSNYINTKGKCQHKSTDSPSCVWTAFNTIFKKTNGTLPNVNEEFGQHASMELSNGALVGFRMCSGPPNCDWNDVVQNQCCQMVVDVNGLSKGPNQAGRDVYMIDLAREGITVPSNAYGGKINGSIDYCTPDLANSAARAGFSCAEKVLKTGQTY